MENFQNQNAKRSTALVGILFIAVGCLLLLSQIGFYYPSWLLSGPTFLIALGVFIGVKNKFKNSASFILITIGTLLLAKRIFDFDSDVIWPIVVIAIGIWLIFFRGKSSKFSWNQNKYDWDKRTDNFNNSSSTTEPGADSQPAAATNEDYSDEMIDSTSIFGSVRKNVLSKNFKGGDIMNFFGGAEINLMSADVQGQAVIEVTQVFGGTKIIVPANWIVKSEMIAIFGGIEDKRPSFNPEQHATKVLVIKGTSIFAGIDIKSY